MSNRFPRTQVMDFCFNPRPVLVNGQYSYFPCGKCPGCLLRKANNWTFRLTDEIEQSKYPVFFTLTYNNKYLPRFIQDGSWHYKSDHKYNIRFDGTKDVLRQDHLELSATPNDNVPVTHEIVGVPSINYASKRDVQLWFKLLRKSIDKQFPHATDRFFRYYAISEIGPTTHRGHVHGILFFENKDISDFCIHTAMYQNWQMCDKALFQRYNRYCDGKTANYLTNYVTGFTQLPQIYKESSLKPWRLASKNSAIGYRSFDSVTVWQKVESGTLEYTKTVDRIGKRYIFCLPSAVTDRVFPKCYKYRDLTLRQLCALYGLLYYAYLPYQRRRLCKPITSGQCQSYRILYQDGWFEFGQHPVNMACASACFNFCVKYSCSPEDYLYLLDSYYYQKSQRILNFFYSKLQEKFEVRLLSTYYTNLTFYLHRYNAGLTTPREELMLSYFAESCGLTILSLINSGLSYKQDPGYVKEVNDILKNAVKIAKYNEYIGQSPTTNF